MHLHDSIYNCVPFKSIFDADSIECVGGVVVNIVAFQAIVPGSIPGRRKIFVPST